ncbi:unnamed protein product, partial [Urochloa humidicola]
ITVNLLAVSEILKMEPCKSMLAGGVLTSISLVVAL